MLGTNAGQKNAYAYIVRSRENLVYLHNVSILQTADYPTGYFAHQEGVVKISEIALFGESEEMCARPVTCSDQLCVYWTIGYADELWEQFAVIIVHRKITLVFPHDHDQDVPAGSIRLKQRLLHLGQISPWDRSLLMHQSLSEKAGMKRVTSCAGC